MSASVGEVSETMEHSVVRTGGHLLRHAVGILLLAWARALRAGLIAGLVGVLLAELAAMLLSGTFPPPGPAHLVAAALGFALALGAMFTMVADELLEGVLDIIKMLVGEAEAGARITAKLAEREVGEASEGLVRRLGLAGLLSVGARASRSAEAAPPALGLVARWATPRPATRMTADEPPRRETLAELADDRRVSAPARSDAWPVRADLLPRIGWTDEHPAVRPDIAIRATPADVALPSAASAPDSAEAPVPVEEPAPARDLPVMDRVPVAGTSDTQPLTLLTPLAAEPLAEPAQWRLDDDNALPLDETWHDPTAWRESDADDAEEAYIQPVDTFGALPAAPAGRPPQATTQPLRETPRPLGAEEARAITRSSVWEHISQVLAGRPVQPLPEEPGAAQSTEAGEAAGQE